MKDFKFKLIIPKGMNNNQFGIMKGILPQIVGRYVFLGVSPENVVKYDLYDFIEVTKEQNEFLNKIGYKKEQ